MHIGALVKQVTEVGGTRAMDDLSRRAVAQAVELAAAVGDGVVTTLSVGDASAEDALREAVAWGATCNVTAQGMLLTDEVFVHLDTLGTARTIAAAAELVGPFDLVLLGAVSSDVGTGQLGPQVAELLDMGYVDSARYLSMQGAALHVRSELDGVFVQATVSLPAVVSCTAGLIDPCGASAASRALVPSERIRVLSDLELLEPPSSRTVVSELQADAEVPSAPELVPPARGVVGQPVVVLAEPDDAELTRALLGWAAHLAAAVGGHTVLITTSRDVPPDAGACGADTVIALAGAMVAEDMAHAVGTWAGDNEPWAILASSSAWGREAAGRAAAMLDAGLAGDVHALAATDGHLVATRRTPRGVVEVTCTSPIGLATLTPDRGAMPTPRSGGDPLAPHTAVVNPRGRVRVVSRSRSTPGLRDR